MVRPCGVAVRSDHILAMLGTCCWNRRLPSLVPFLQELAIPWMKGSRCGHGNNGEVMTAGWGEEMFASEHVVAIGKHCGFNCSSW